MPFSCFHAIRSPHHRAFTGVLLALLLAACERRPGASRADSTPPAVLAARDSATQRRVASGWSSAAGPVLLVQGPGRAEAIALYPTADDSNAVAQLDSASMRQMVKLTLSGAGYQVVEASDGADGLAKARAATVDMVVTDLNMPVMNGLECVKALREARLGPQMKVMMVTTEADHSFIATALDNGADEFLMKPFTPESLREKMLLLGVIAA